MIKSLLNIILLSVVTGLTACTSNPFQQMMPSYHSTEKSTTAEKSEPTGTGELAANGVGGNLDHAMDEIDRSKMLHALDKAPGTPTHWVNANTGISYTVVPVKKVVVNGNEFCRTYTTTASRDNKEKQFGGTACVGEDGNWRSIN